jgi:hypothetical protein
MQVTRAPVPVISRQLFFEVFTYTVEYDWLTLSLLHFGQVGFVVSCSEMEACWVKLLPQELQRYS